MPISSALIALTMPKCIQEFRSECESLWVRLDNPVVRLYERLRDKPRLECALPSLSTAKRGITGVSHVALRRLVREETFVAEAFGRASKATRALGCARMDAVGNRM